MGAGDDPACRKGITWLQRASLDWDKPWGRSPLYYWYYVTQAKFHFSDDVFTPWDRQMKGELPTAQVRVPYPADNKKDMGYWEAAGTGEPCKSRVYNTTLCALMLQVYYRHLATYDTKLHEPVDFAQELDRDLVIDLIEQG